jgi:hypothetical protein
MMIDLKPFINDDKNAKMNSDFFMGTTIQSLGNLKGYSVQMMFLGMAIPSKVVITHEEAVKMETEVWEAMK